MPNRRTLVALPFVAIATLAVELVTPFAPAAVAATCGAGSAALGNGGFETPGVEPGTYTLEAAADVAPWQTTDVANQIEIWGDGFLGVPAQEGASFAELNANSPGTLYQDVVTSPGATMTWTLHHRGREGTDTMKVLVGDAATADVNGDDGWNASSDDLVDDTSAWGEHSDTYVVPAGQTCTRFGFRAVSTSGGNPSVGNLLDGISFAVSIPAGPTATPAPKPTSKPRPSHATARPVIKPPETDTLDDGTAPLAGALGLLAVLGGVATAAVLAVRARRRRT
ncbi:MAG TPA: hypothetical protein VFI28_05500 [Candidatus Limnocylindrales bacterium]|nr:hypothetical protein [Candidatus Limnocylindrales bacterium]